MTDTLFETIKKTILIPPHPAGLPFIFGGLIVSFLLFLVWSPLGFLGFILTGFCCYFFRDPKRVVPTKKSLIVSAADGTISAIVEGCALPHEMGSSDGRYTRISTFLSVLDVHVNRIPVDGKIIRKVYTPGKFLNADLDKASEDNERCGLIVQTANNQTIAVVQIAGLIARRIVNDVREDQDVQAGHRFGIIRFGSRVDVYLPEGIAPLVCVGQKVIGGETVLADLLGDEAPREGQII
jgi:phosphatidylserine decarboxylase